jgi:hypothetical protein
MITKIYAIACLFGPHPPGEQQKTDKLPFFVVSLVLKLLFPEPNFSEISA